jgi:hypothetical protein
MKPWSEYTKRYIEKIQSRKKRPRHYVEDDIELWPEFGETFAVISIVVGLALCLCAATGVCSGAALTGVLLISIGVNVFLLILGGNK